ncbi:MAG: FAD-dependent oxidoreductase [Chloroflexota bacterium]|nr:FAD-dependent oxidoreductase [Chloroflexota bacterium]
MAKRGQRNGSQGNDDATYDLIVIGGGAAGSTVAFDAVRRGVRVALIEEWKLGGTCLNAGCDPTKTLVRSAEVLHLARTADRFGLTVTDPRADWPAVRARVEGVIDTIRGGNGEANVRDAGIDLYSDHARFVSEREVVVGGNILTGDRFVIATGATTSSPDIDGIETVGYITNLDVPTLDALPESLIVVGGGPVAVEFAQIFARFGVEVTVLASRDQLLPKEEPELAHALSEILESEGIRIETGARASDARVEGGQKVLVWDTEDSSGSVAASEILIATGRRPNVRKLGLEAAGVAFSDRGIEVDATMQTSVPAIWAVGDVTGIYPFTHAADYQARIAEHNAFATGAVRRADYRGVPWTTFTDPELARVGLTEAEAMAGGYAVVTATVAFDELPPAITSDQRLGSVKLVVDRATHQILGGHILAAHAGELLGEVALAMRNRLPISAISDTIHSYPTMSEAVFWAAYQIVTEKLAGSVPVPEW